MSKRLKMSLLGLVAIALLTQIADAQLFRRNIQRTRVATVESPCPGGTCVTSQSARQVVRGAQVAPVFVPVTLVAPVQPQPKLAPVVVPISSSGSTFGLGEVSVLKPVEIPDFVLAQIDDAPLQTARDSFRSNLVKAVAKERKAGKITMRDAVRLRVAMMSPAFIERAHDLAVTQVAFSGEASEAIPMSDDGTIQVEGINWEGLAKFLEAILPLLLTLLKAFGV